MNYIITIILFIFCNLKGYSQDWRYVPGKKVYKNLEEAFKEKEKVFNFQLYNERLDLSDNKIIAITLSNNPGGFKNLEVLSLANNSLSEFPDFIFESSGLKKLDLAENKIAIVPPKIYKLNNLETLYLSVNPILDIPEEISTLKKLKWLGIQITRISQDKFAIIKTHLPANCVVTYEIKERKSGYMIPLRDLIN